MSQTIQHPGCTCETISGTVCGKLDITINNFNEIKCPICGDYMEVCGMEYIDSFVERSIMAKNEYVDGGGISHCQSFGRDKHTEENVLSMHCPNHCVKEMKLNVKHITFGGYREFTEISR